MANPFGGSNVRLAVLEEKLIVYEDLSKEMLAKLEAAVDKISEANQNVAKILVRHEERLDQGIQSFSAISKLIDGSRLEHEKEINKVNKQIQSLDLRLDELSKFRWILAGILIIVGILAGQINVIESIFPPVPSVHSSK